MRLRKFLDSSRRFKWLLAEAFIRLGVAMAIKFLPLPRRSRFLMRAHFVSSPSQSTCPSSQEVCRAVDVAARFVPGVTCLVKAHVCSAMLNRFGYAAEIKLGVLKRSSDLAAHAWVECDGRAVMGGSGNRYVELPKVLLVG